MALRSAMLAAAARVQDSAAALPHAPCEGVDSVVVESPLPGGVAAVVRFLLDAVPWWVQLGGMILGVLVGIAVLAFGWIRRAEIAAWLAAHSRRVQWALAAGLFLVLLGATGFGAAAWDYTQHDNGFCTGCHVMNPSFQEFMNFEDKHDTLSCHDCHQQSVFASMRQLYLWVAERPEEIRPHAKVANAVCMKCHVIEGDTAVWQRIAATAGHRVHIESDSTVLQDLQCVTCHGEEVHRFVPAPKTCGQSDCHKQEDTKIVLGKMADQTASHCTACHRFTADVPRLATVDSARGTLVPAQRQCLSCHEMEAILADFRPALEPHGATCGTCHNPHLHETPAAAVTSCAAAKCHDNWRDEPFHVGKEHRTGADRCLTCHLPHQSKVDASDCEGCHREVRARSRLRPPVPFDTLGALRRISLLPDLHPMPPGDLRGKGDAPPEDAPSGGVLWRPAVPAPATGPAPQDSFPHAPHRRHACLECHTNREGHGGLTFVPPRGCNICHHQAPARSDCATCHRAQPPAPVQHLTVRVTVPNEPVRAREVPFSHETHVAKRCTECHTTPVTLAPTAALLECRSCHEEHHTADRSCAACHTAGDLRARHEDPKTSHQRCDACHTPTTVALLTPTRPFCLTCHEPQRADHYVQKECTVCHFLAEPAAFRPRLVGAAGTR